MYYRARYYDPSVGRFLSEDLHQVDTGLALIPNGTTAAGTYHIHQSINQPPTANIADLENSSEAFDRLSAFITAVEGWVPSLDDATAYLGTPLGLVKKFVPDLETPFSGRVDVLLSSPCCKGSK